MGRVEEEGKYWFCYEDRRGELRDELRNWEMRHEIFGGIRRAGWFWGRGRVLWGWVVGCWLIFLKGG